MPVRVAVRGPEPHFRVPPHDSSPPHVAEQEPAPYAIIGTLGGAPKQESTPLQSRWQAPRTAGEEARIGIVREARIGCTASHVAGARAADHG